MTYKSARMNEIRVSVDVKAERQTVLGRMVKGRREWANLTMRQAGQQIGISTATVHRVEHGESPDIESFARLCAWLHIQPQEFLDENGLRRVS